jgi:hypothetical protein
MIGTREFGILFHQIDEKFIFFVETANGPFIYFIKSGDEIKAFMKGYPGIQVDRFYVLDQGEAWDCHINLEKISLADKLKD